MHMHFFYTEEAATECRLRCVGSEMCIRDVVGTVQNGRQKTGNRAGHGGPIPLGGGGSNPSNNPRIWASTVCCVRPVLTSNWAICKRSGLLYTSDVADEGDSADLVCRIFIEKKRVPKRSVSYVD